MSDAFTIVLTSQALWAHAGDQSYTRGVAYYEDGRVQGLMHLDDTLVADVVGTQTYHVELRITNGAIVGNCDCPIGDSGHFCKHCVAVGLAFLEGGELGSAPIEPRVPTPDIRGYLSSLNKEAIVAMLMDLVTRDADLREQLAVRASRQGNAAVDLAIYRAAFARAVSTGGYVSYREAPTYIHGISRVHRLFSELLESGAADKVITLTEEAYVALERAYEEVDDSDGMLCITVGEFLELHHDACLIARPEPVALARKLFAWEVKSGFGFFDGAQDNYADVLGDEGRAEYRRLAQEAWDRQASSVSQRGDIDTIDWNRRMLARMLEGFARDDGDVDAVVAIKSSDLSLPYYYLEIAQVLEAAGRKEEALDWAERGIAAFPDDRDSRLVLYLAGLYQQRQRHDDAMALVWALFTSRPYLPEYQYLQEHAERATAWPYWRARAWECLNENMTVIAANRQPKLWGQQAGSEPVGILLWEGDPTAAWQVAREYGCSNELWVELAGLRADDHPVDALTVYKQQVDHVLTSANQQAYERAIAYIRLIVPLLHRVGDGKEVGQYIATLRETHRRKRNFIKLLDAERWG